jgi:hypothetical protein
MLIQQQKLYSIKLKGNILNREDMEGDSLDIFGGITLQSSVEYYPAVSCREMMVCGKENLRSSLYKPWICTEGMEVRLH